MIVDPSLHLGDIIKYAPWYRLLRDSMLGRTKAGMNPAVARSGPEIPLDVASTRVI